MPNRVRSEQRSLIIKLLQQGRAKNEIADAVGVSAGQVAAIAAHLTMGTYDSLLGNSSERKRGASKRSPKQAGPLGAREITIGRDTLSGIDVQWNPFDSSSTPNPHVLIVGKSGFGKTYAITGLVMELAMLHIPSVILDYGQGFTPTVLPASFPTLADATFIDASVSGIEINPLQIFPTDVHGPVSVAQRVADTFARVYRRLGVQQHAALRDAVLTLFQREGIHAGVPSTWDNPTPPFIALSDTLESLRKTGTDSRQRHLDSAASHISTLFVFNTFRTGGLRLSWDSIFAGRGGVYVIQMRGLEKSVEQAVTEFLLWSLIGTCEAHGPSTLKCFIVLDEAHRLSFGDGSPVAKLLREGRKFGLAAILASQQPEDFSSVAFANTATKLIFQVSDERDKVSKAVHSRSGLEQRVVKNTISQLPRGHAYVVSGSYRGVVEVFEFDERCQLWSTRKED